MFIREVEEELIDEDIDVFLSSTDRQRGDRPLSSFSANDISKLFERQISGSSQGRGVRDSLSEGKLEPFKLNDRMSSRRSCTSTRQRIKSEAEAKARKEEEEKKKKEQGLFADITLRSAMQIYKHVMASVFWHYMIKCFIFFLNTYNID